MEADTKSKTLVTRSSKSQPLQRTVFLLSIFSKLLCIPFKITFEDDALKIKLKNSRSFSVFFWKFLSAGTVVNTVGLTLDLLNHSKVYTDAHNQFELILHIVWVGSFMCMSIYHLHFLTQRKNVANLINQVISLGHYLKDGFFKKEFLHAWERIDLVMILFFANACFGITFYTLLFLQFPAHRRYIYGALDPSWQTPAVYVLMGIYEGFFIIFQWGGLLTECFLHFLYMGTTTTALGLLRTSKIESLQSLENKLKVYQKVRLLGRIYADSSESFILPALQLTLGLIGVFSAAGTIILLHDMDPIVIIILIVFSIATSAIQFYLYVKASKIHKSSTEAGEYFHLIARSRLEKVACNGCPPIGVKIGNFFVLQKMTPLTALGIVVNSVINVILLA